VDKKRPSMIETDFAKAVLGIIAIIIAFIGYVPYFRDIVRGQTEPHCSFTELYPNHGFIPCIPRYHELCVYHHADYS